MKKIQYVSPSIADLEMEYVHDAVRNGWGANCYHYINRFEQEFARFHNMSFGHATSSCTGALHLGLAASEIGPGSEVILAETNWVATVAPVVHLGATPILVDIDPISWCIDANQVERAISPRTRAVIVTHLYGNLCDIDSLKDICRRKNLLLIEDAAEAFGSRYKGRLAGSFGDFSVFSFHGTKTLTTGEGGILLTNNENLYQKVCTLNNHGRSKDQKKQFWPEELGYKFKMSNIQAALGLAQLHRARDLVDKKIEIFRHYHRRLSGSLLMNQSSCSKFSPGYWMPTVVTESPKEKERILNSLSNSNIDARTFFWPLSTIFPRMASLGSLHAFDIAARALNLPAPYDINEEDIDRICNLVLCED